MPEINDLAMQALSQVIDPDLNNDIVSLDMVQDLEISGGVASFRFVLTTPACPLKDQFLANCEAVLAAHRRHRHGENHLGFAACRKGLHGNLNMPIQQHRGGSERQGRRRQEYSCHQSGGVAGESRGARGPDGCRHLWGRISRRWSGWALPVRVWWAKKTTPRWYPSRPTASK